jgi:hypothetical protein
VSRIWTVLVVGVVIFDVALLAEKIAFGGGQRELLHRLGPIIVPLYLTVAGAWLWLAVRVATGIKERRSVDWKRVLLLAVVASLPLIL